ncbi:hypothetical protein OK348_13565 [Flavobacterium sp. MXW15]|uniref:Uncharacterized protein n=1 Tax=Xanthomonas chitinilytica TaxID=2989819 RepID=A0ABT3JX01_9XANT|nr:hypothetical protein [Xanthomonas sp. H13-6]MCW4455813.1 hypothetical protein [Flavobacterium sp. MXW15]MCW4473028.1 hypothetical protein [Xanthomonas sp. H13-6]
MLSGSRGVFGCRMAGHSRAPGDFRRDHRIRVSGDQHFALTRFLSALTPMRLSKSVPRKRRQDLLQGSVPEMFQRWRLAGGRAAVFHPPPVPT